MRIQKAYALLILAVLSLLAFQNCQQLRVSRLQGQESVYNPIHEVPPNRKKIGVSSWIHNNEDILFHAAKSKSLGVQSFRMGIYWKNIESTQGVFNWSNFDQIVDAYTQNGIELVVPILGSPPWANNSTNQYAVPVEEEAFQQWLQNYVIFVTKIVTRYRGKVRNWELWNEPNLQNYWDPTPDPQQYLVWGRAIEEAILSVDPEAAVAWGDLCAFDMMFNVTNQISGRDFLTYLLDAGVKPRYVSVHPYQFTNDHADRFTPDNSTNEFRDVEKLIALLEARGLSDTEIWITEYGWKRGTVLGNPPIEISAGLQAFNLFRTFRLFDSKWPSKVTKLLWFWERDLPGSTRNGFGLYDENWVLTPAGELFSSYSSARAQIPKEVYYNGFENPSDLQIGAEWKLFTNGANGEPGTAEIVFLPTPNISNNMNNYIARVHTGALNNSAAYPGTYLESPLIPVESGNISVGVFAKNASGSLEINYKFYSNDNQQIGKGNYAIPQSADFNLNEQRLTAPNGAKKMTIRFRLRQPDSTLDIDRLEIIR